MNEANTIQVNTRAKSRLLLSSKCPSRCRVTEVVNWDTDFYFRVPRDNLCLDKLRADFDNLQRSVRKFVEVD